MREQSKSLRPESPFACLSFAGTATLFLILIIPIFGKSSNQWQSPARLDIPQADSQDSIKINVDLVVLHASVQDNDRLPVTGLNKENFQIYEDGVLQEIESFDYADIPVTVGLVIDNSGSMRPKRSEVIEAALAFARASNAKDQVFVVNFNERVFFGLPENMEFTNDQTKLKIALHRYNAEGMTALYDATAAGLEHLKKGDRDKRVLIVVSDGGDNASRHNLAQIMTQAKLSDTIIYTIGIFSSEDPDQNPRVLKQLAKATGGEAFLPKSIKEIVNICEQIAHDIRNQYTLTYAPVNTNFDGKYRVIKVKAATPEGKRLIVRTRAGYFAQLKP